MNSETLSEIGAMKVVAADKFATDPSASTDPSAAKHEIKLMAPSVKTLQASGISLLWRQSMIHDILRCPRMAAQEWIFSASATGMNSPIEDDAKRGFIAAVFGTAAHKVIEEYNINLAVGKELHYTDMLEIFEAEAEKEYDITSEVIPIPKKCETFTEAMQGVGADYMQYITGHIAYEMIRKPAITVTASEQKFAMFVNYTSELYGAELYLFTGMIDQLGVCNEDGRLLLRDFKFRDNAFKPTWRQLQVDPQMIIYACAMKYGVPTCSYCEPKYTTGALTALNPLERKIQYDGPCEECIEKIGTYLWPREFPDAGELLWMKDYRILKRGTAHRKKGEIAGEGVYNFCFNSDNAESYMRDVMQHCSSFRHGFHPRKYGEACKFWCRHAENCVNELTK